jgi:hypothetical protein
VVGLFAKILSNLSILAMPGLVANTLAIHFFRNLPMTGLVAKNLQNFGNLPMVDLVAKNLIIQMFCNLLMTILVLLGILIFATYR